MNNVGLVIAITTLKDKVDVSLPLEERIVATMRYARKNIHEIFWMTLGTDDDVFRASIGAVMETATDDDEKERLNRSFTAMKTLNAALSGIPVDIGEIDMDGIIAFPALWAKSGEEVGGEA